MGWRPSLRDHADGEGGCRRARFYTRCARLDALLMHVQQRDADRDDESEDARFGDAANV
jgi:hypothetical protein